jgi:hypothetical protein
MVSVSTRPDLVSCQRLSAEYSLGLVWRWRIFAQSTEILLRERTVRREVMRKAGNGCFRSQ